MAFLLEHQLGADQKRGHHPQWVIDGAEGPQHALPGVSLWRTRILMSISSPAWFQMTLGTLPSGRVTGRKPDCVLEPLLSAGQTPYKPVARWGIAIPPCKPETCSLRSSGGRGGVLPGLLFGPRCAVVRQHRGSAPLPLALCCGGIQISTGCFTERMAHSPGSTPPTDAYLHRKELKRGHPSAPPFSTGLSGYLGPL